MCLGDDPKAEVEVDGSYEETGGWARQILHRRVEILKEQAEHFVREEESKPSPKEDQNYWKM